MEHQLSFNNARPINISQITVTHMYIYMYDNFKKRKPVDKFLILISSTLSIY